MPPVSREVLFLEFVCVCERERVCLLEQVIQVNRICVEQAMLVTA